MDSSLEGIWDEPLAQHSPKRTDRTHDADDNDDAPHRPAKRARQALFLADSDDDLESGPSNSVVHKAPPAQDVDIDALFADFDEDEDFTSLKPLPARVDEAELTRRAEANYRMNIPPLTPHEILPSSSPQRDIGAQGGNKRSNTKEKGGDEKKARRRIVKLDENRLLSENGFPQLIKMTKDFKIKGKGHEATDLNRLLQIYQYWTHQLYPKTQFQDTVERIEKLCHSRRMNVSLSVWRDEAHGRPKARNHDEEEDGDEGDVNQADETRMETGDPTSDLPPSSPPRSSPMSSPAPIQAQTQPPPVPPSNNLDEDEQEAFWASLDEPNEDSFSDVPAAPTTAENSSMDEDEDVWDIVNEVEQESSAQPAAPPAPPLNPTSTAPPGNITIPEDDDWDDMYV